MIRRPLTVLALALTVACGAAAAPSPRAVSVTIAPPPPARAEPAAHDAVRRLALVKTVPRVPGKDPKGGPAFMIEPFVGSSASWFDTEWDSGEGRFFTIASLENPRPALRLRSLFRDRTAAQHLEDTVAFTAKIDEDHHRASIDAVDLQTGTTVWRNGTLTPDSKLTVAATASTQGEVAFILQSGLATSLVVLDRQSGSTLWRTPWEKSSPPALVAAGEGVFASAHHVGSALENVAFDARTGRALWQHPIRTAHPQEWANPSLRLFASGDRVVALDDDGVTALVLDARSGRELGRMKLPGTVDSAVLTDRTLLFLVVTHGECSDGCERHVVSVSPSMLSAGARREPPRYDLSLESIGEVNVLVRDGYLFITALGLARIYDLESGSLLWDWGFGEDTWMSFGDTALVGLSPHFGDAHSQLVYANSDAFYLFEPVASPPAVEDAVVQGTLRRDRGLTGGAIYAHGTSTVADENGHYALKVPTRGAVTVSAVVGNRHESRAIRLTGARSYELDIEELNECVENCGD